jgi:hypothetical protein
MNLPTRSDAINHSSLDVPAKGTAVKVLANERELPVGWKWLAMSDICLKVQDGTHFSPKEQSASGDYKYITAKNIKTWGLDLTELTYVTESFHREIYKRCNPEKGDILYIKDGVTTGIATVNTLDEPFSLLSSVALLKPRREIIDPYFLKYYLNSPEGFRRMTGQMTGTAIKRLILQKIKQAGVPVAPLPEQRRIVSEIEKQFTRLDVGVASLKRVQTALKRYRASVLKAACEGLLVLTEAELARREGRPYETGEQFLARNLAERRKNWTGRGKNKEPARFDTASLPPLPEGWTWASVEQLLIEPLCNGVSVKGSDNPPGVRALRLSAMSDSGFDYSDARYLPLSEPEVDDLWIKEGDFFMSRGNGSLHLVGRGTSAQNPPQPTIFPDTMIRWVSALNLFEIFEDSTFFTKQLIRFFDLAFELARQFPHDGVLKYAAGRIAKLEPSGEAAELIEHLLMQCAQVEAGAMSFVLASMLKNPAVNASTQRKRHRMLLHIIENHAPLRHSSEVAWAVWACIALKLRLPKATIRAVIKMEDSICSLLALHARELKLVEAPDELKPLREAMDAEALYGSRWLLSYQANMKGWFRFRGSADYVTKDPNFGLLKNAGVSFYDESKTVLPRSESELMEARRAGTDDYLSRIVTRYGENESLSNGEFE